MVSKPEVDAQIAEVEAAAAKEQGALAEQEAVTEAASKAGKGKGAAAVSARRELKVRPPESVVAGDPPARQQLWSRRHELWRCRASGTK